MIYTFKQVEKIISLIESKNKELIDSYKEQIYSLNSRLEKERLRGDMAVDQLLNIGSKVGTVMPEKTSIMVKPPSREAITLDKIFNGDTFGEFNKVGEDDGPEDKTTKEEII